MLFRPWILVFLISVILFSPEIVVSRELKAEQAGRQAAELDWPGITREHKPWTFWWWMGNAVNKAELTRHLEIYAKAGIGGVSICPVYGVEGYEDQSIAYLSPEWMDMLAYTIAEAERLGMGVDMWNCDGCSLLITSNITTMAFERIRICFCNSNYLRCNCYQINSCSSNNGSHGEIELDRSKEAHES